MVSRETKVLRNGLLVPLWTLLDGLVERRDVIQLDLPLLEGHHHIHHLCTGCRRSGCPMIKKIR